METKKKKFRPGIDFKIDYDSDAETDIFDYFEDDDPFKEIIIS